ncbi:MAG: hypothetical protein RTU92_04405 [Candidatus Thorarchaeota archaeon]
MSSEDSRQLWLGFIFVILVNLVLLGANEIITLGDFTSILTMVLFYGSIIGIFIIVYTLIISKSNEDYQVGPTGEPIGT